MIDAAPPRLRAFLEAAPRGSLRVLKAFAAAESMSDWLARDLLDLVCLGQKQLDQLVPSVHVAGFVVERNSEWHIAEPERRYLVSELVKDENLFTTCHARLAELAMQQVPLEGSELPAYLTQPVGRAYHVTAIAPSQGLPLYQEAYSGRLGDRWLAARLALEQQEHRLIPRNAIEPAFLRGMVLYREGRIEKAMRVLQPVAYAEEVRREVAVAAHLYARSLRRSDPVEAERLLRRSLALQEALDDPLGEAHVLHSLAQLLGPARHSEAIELLKKSLSLGESLQDKHHQAEVLHTMGAISSEQNTGQGIELLRSSLALLEDANDRHGQAQVLHTLGQNLWDTNAREAEQLLQRSIGILTALNDKFGRAQVLHTLGQKLASTDRETAEVALRQSLEIGEQIGNLRHQAMVLMTLGAFIWPGNQAEGRRLLLRSLELERVGRNHVGERLVLRELARRGIEPDAFAS